ncbi:MAG: hypothetical protein JEZ14_05545 [Marinilabiliaceae bacterium]|nr:hypothetical protein [Marinilabiliaceae bacterium]
MRRIFLFLGLGLTFVANAQDKTSGFDVGADMVSRYVWRGTDFGSSPAIQPILSYRYGSLSLGAWGSYSTNNDSGADEGDLFASYTLSTGTELLVTDYFFPAPGLDYFDYANHFLEFGIKQSIKYFYISGYYMAVNGTDDLYFEGGFKNGNVALFIGAGNEAYTPKEEGKFNICNAGITISKDLRLSQEFTLPLFGSLIYNPSAKGIHMVVGITI